jgi:hypothetical protein
LDQQSPQSNLRKLSETFIPVFVLVSTVNGGIESIWKYFNLNTADAADQLASLPDVFWYLHPFPQQVNSRLVQSSPQPLSLAVMVGHLDWSNRRQLER